MAGSGASNRAITMPLKESPNGVSDRVILSSCPVGKYNAIGLPQAKNPSSFKIPVVECSSHLAQ